MQGLHAIVAQFQATKAPQPCHKKKQRWMCRRNQESRTFTSRNIVPSSAVGNAVLEVISWVATRRMGHLVVSVAVCTGKLAKNPVVWTSWKSKQAVYGSICEKRLRIACTGLSFWKKLRLITETEQRQLKNFWPCSLFKSAMSNPNGFLSQKLCHYLDQGRTLNNILMRTAHWMAYVDLSKLNLLERM